MFRISANTTTIKNRLRLGNRTLLQTNKKRTYHDDGVYGYRVPKEYRLPDYTTEELSNRMKYGSLLRMVQAYRTHGHEGAHLDPLNIMKRK
jgi:probable 2-oxoglutarate dehydrogenase E1 component DHKTD1